MRDAHACYSPSALILLNNGSKDQERFRYAKEAIKVLASLRWKGESSWLSKEREKKSYAEVAKIYGKNESSVCEIEKKEKEIYACFDPSYDMLS